MAVAVGHFVQVSLCSAGTLPWTCLLRFMTLASDLSVHCIRRLVMKDDYKRPATPAEIAKMREQVRQGMQEKAFGMSAGLEYVPGFWSTTDELIDLVREIVPYGGVYTVHQLSESTDPRWYQPSIDKPGQPTMLDAVEETIRIGAETGPPQR